MFKIGELVILANAPSYIPYNIKPGARGFVDKLYDDYAVIEFEHYRTSVYFKDLSHYTPESSVLSKIATLYNRQPYVTKGVQHAI